MLKKLMRLIITLTIVTALLVVILYAYNRGRTYYNDENVSGNTAGNIYNGGLFCEMNGKIYFSNNKAGGSLYVMDSDLTRLKKLRNDKAVFINADDNYIYYIRANDINNSDTEHMMFYNSGVYRVKLNGSELKAYTSDPSSYLTLKGNSIYFQKYDLATGYSLYKYQIDGESNRLLVKDAATPVNVSGTGLYFTPKAHNQCIRMIDLKSFIIYQAFEGSYLQPIFRDGYIYYMDAANDNIIYRMNQDGSGKELLVDSRCSTYNITNSGIYLYYQVDDQADKGIYRLKLDTMEVSRLLDGDYKQINVTEKYVFFRDADNSNTYIISADGYPEVNVFDPEASSSKAR
ncbi:MAG: DUF5050 domain-containing protein [Clostridiales bacterium]|nr:DUF5050 domain-containing protein [Clostridiales bacterium]